MQQGLDDAGTPHVSVAYVVPFVHGKQRPRFGGHVHTADATAENERQIAYAYKGASIRKYGRVVCAPAHVPVRVHIRCTVPAPKRRPSWYPKALWDALGGVPFVRMPDYDNVAKEHTDALNGVAYHDDAQVTEAHIYKTMRVIGGREAATVKVEWEEPNGKEPQGQGHG